MVLRCGIRCFSGAQSFLLSQLNSAVLRFPLTPLHRCGCGHKHRGPTGAPVTMARLPARLTSAMTSAAVVVGLKMV